MRILLYIGALAMVLAAGCAMVGGEVRMIGTEADFINKAGFTDKVEVNWFASNAYRVDRKAEFSKDSERVVWFMVFQNGSYLSNETFTAKWISPDGSLYVQNTFTQVPGSWNIAVTDLVVAGTLAAGLPGRWTLEIYHRDRRIAARSFVITP